MPARGFPEYYANIRKEGLRWNHKRVRRVYRKLGMARRRKMKGRIQNPEKTMLLQPVAPNLTWSIDFMEDRLENTGIKHVRIQKGKPSQNGFIERFNRTFREDVLDMNIFGNIHQNREKTEEFLEDYNYHHPHDSPGKMNPNEFIKTKTKNKSA